MKQATAEHKAAADAQQRRRTNGRAEERPADGEDSGEHRAGGVGEGDGGRARSSGECLVDIRGGGPPRHLGARVNLIVHRIPGLLCAWCKGGLACNTYRKY